MSYWTLRTEAGYRDGATYHEESVRRMEANLGRADLVVHGIGGIGDETTGEDLLAFAETLSAMGAVGGSIYDWATLDQDDGSLSCAASSTSTPRSTERGRRVPGWVEQVPFGQDGAHGGDGALGQETVQLREVLVEQGNSAITQRANMPSSIQAAPSGARFSTAQSPADAARRRWDQLRASPIIRPIRTKRSAAMSISSGSCSATISTRDGPAARPSAPRTRSPARPGPAGGRARAGPTRGRLVRRRRGGGQAQAAAADVDRASLARLRSDHRLLTCVADDGGQAPMAVDHMGQAHRPRVDGTVVEGPGAALDHDGHGLPGGRGVEADQGGHQVDGIGARRARDRRRRVDVVHLLAGQADEHRRTAPTRLLSDGVELTGDRVEVTDRTRTGATGAGHGGLRCVASRGRASMAPVRPGREPTASVPGPCDSRPI